MSRAFTKESEEEWLGDVAPEISALERFLSREQGRGRISLVQTTFHPELQRDVHEMSNGNCYALDDDNRWYLVV